MARNPYLAKRPRAEGPELAGAAGPEPDALWVCLVFAAFIIYAMRCIPMKIASSLFNPACLASTALIAFFSSFASSRADPTNTDHFPAEAAQLKTAYEQAVEQAIKPIRDRYIADLKQLLDQETNEGNKAQADAIRVELDTLPGGSDVSGDTIPEFESRLVGVPWKWHGDHYVSFEFGGKSGGDELTWKSVAPYVVEYKTRDGVTGTVTFDRGLNTGTIKETTPDGVERTSKMVRNKQS